MPSVSGTKKRMPASLIILSSFIRRHVGEIIGAVVLLCIIGLVVLGWN